MKYLFALIFTLTAFSSESIELNGPLQTGWKGQKVCEKLSENNHQNILRCTFPPGVGHEKHKHNGNFGYAISGGKVKITDQKGSRIVDLKSNSYFDSSGTDWHEIINVGDTTIIYLILESKE
ncbi:MAG: hypothetical protein AB8B80_04160 [Marinicellaceae bacterium]